MSSHDEKKVDPSGISLKQKRARTTSKRLFMRQVKNVCQGIEDGEDVDLVKDWFEEVRLSRANVQEHHVLYVNTLDDDEAEEAESWLDEVETSFNEVQRIWYKYRSKKESEAIKRKEEKAGQIGIKLNRVELPKFSGEVRDYPRFKTDFQNQVMPHTASEDAAAYTLRSCLNKRGQDVIKLVDTLKEMWEKLDEEFGDPSMVSDIIINDIKRFRMKDDKRKLIEFIEVIEQGYHDLRRLEMEKEISNTAVVSMIEAKLPEETRRKWAEKVCSDESEVSRKDKFPHLLKFLQETKRTLNYMNTDLRDPGRGNVQSTSKPGYVNFTTQEEKTIKLKCLVHGTGHSTEMCRAYQALNHPEKMKLLKEKGGCWACLKRGHIQKDCKRKKKCGIRGCSEYHHETLHSKTETAPPQPVMTNLSSTGDRDSACLLQVMEVQAGSEDEVKLNVLWDGGATISLITKKKAAQLGLEGFPCQLSCWCWLCQKADPIKEVHPTTQRSKRQDRRNNSVRN